MSHTITHSRVYGLNLSIDRLVSNLLLAQLNVAVDVTVHFLENAESIRTLHQLGWQRQFPAVEQESGGVEVWQNSSSLLLRYRRTTESVLEFFLDREGTQVQILKPPCIPESDAISFLLGPVLGCVLRLRQQICLHASVLVWQGQAFMLVGPKGSGKSTTAAALLQQGAALLADDVAVFSRRYNAFEVEAGYPQLRLMLAPIRSLGYSSERLQPVLSVGEKCYVPLNSQKSWNFYEKACPLACVYLLKERQKHSDIPVIEQLNQSSALLKLTPHSYTKYMLDDEARQREFYFLGQLVNKLPVRTVSNPSGLDFLSQISQVILHDFQSVLKER
ncbi:hypothetical protein H206_02811 [Candidatus Electrothrix aarhusensis]|uniref:Hpr(Ser) kinase/phosphatase n=1 Tax=Candidatus Electrothrix aarhusensis TaxID=1859131 RepID=A0A3S3QE40_9BACT|nr:hypothetical protein H206_02811 [Candidatus Electrothrix aarhusensis]